MNKLWFSRVLILLSIALLMISSSSSAHSIKAEKSSEAPSSPIMGPIIDIWEDSISNVSPKVAYNSLHDEYLVVWANYRPLTADIYAQRVGSDGSLRSWFAVVSVEGERYSYPSVAYSQAQDQYLIVYEHETSPNDYDLKAKRISWDGGLISTEFNIRDDVDEQRWPAVVYNSVDDEYLVVYNNRWVGGLDDIAAQRVRASDGALLSWRNIATGAGGDGKSRYYPDVAYNQARNEYLIAYSYGFNHTNWDIYARLASASLGNLSSEIHIEDNSEFQEHVSLAAGPDEYLAVWDDGPLYVFSPDYRTIQARRVTGDGTLQPAMEIIDLASQAHERPDVAYGGVGGYLLTWRYLYGGVLNDDDVYGRYVGSGQDQPSGSPFNIYDPHPINQNQAALACDPLAHCLVVFMDELNPGSSEIDPEIRGRFVNLWLAYIPMVFRNSP